MLSVNKRSTLPLNVKIYSLLTTFQWNKSSEIYFPDCITFCASVGRQCRYCLLSDDLCHSVTQTEHARNESSFPSAFLLKCLPHVVVCGRRTFHRFQGLWFPCMLTVCQLSFKSILNAPTHHVHFCHPLPAFLFLLGFISGRYLFFNPQMVWHPHISGFMHIYGPPRSFEIPKPATSHWVNKNKAKNKERLLFCSTELKLWNNLHF